LSIKTN